MAGGLAVLAAAAAVSGAPASRAPPASVPGRSLLAGLPPASLGGPCLSAGHAFLRARIQGAVRLDIDLRGAALKCEGEPRLDGSGIRLGFEGRVPPIGRVRMIFGIDGARKDRSGRELPTNLTVIFEDRKLIFATQGDGSCTTDRLTQEPIGGGRAPTHAYRVVAHGFCIAPVNDVGGRRRIIVTAFDFAGRADFKH